MAKLVDQSALRITGGMVVMQGTWGGCLLRSRLRPVLMGFVVLAPHQLSNLAMHRSTKRMLAGRAVGHAVVQAQGLRQQQRQAQRPGSAKVHRNMDHPPSVAGLSMATVLARPPMCKPLPSNVGPRGAVCQRAASPIQAQSAEQKLSPRYGWGGGTGAVCR